jgi:hypothetical protein
MESSIIYHIPSSGILCPFDFSLYPFDVQICKFKLSSTALTINALEFKTESLVDNTGKHNHKSLNMIDHNNMASRGAIH